MHLYQQSNAETFFHWRTEHVSGSNRDVHLRAHQVLSFNASAKTMFSNQKAFICSVSAHLQFVEGSDPFKTHFQTSQNGCSEFYQVFRHKWSKNKFLQCFGDLLVLGMLLKHDWTPPVTDWMHRTKLGGQTYLDLEWKPSHRSGESFVNLCFNELIWGRPQENFSIIKSLQIKAVYSMILEER